MQRKIISNRALDLISCVSVVSSHDERSIFLYHEPDMVDILDLISRGFLEGIAKEGSRSATAVGGRYYVTKSGVEYVSSSDLERAVLDARWECKQ